MATTPRPITPATRAKRHAAAVAAITKRHTRDGDARTQEHHGARVGDWTLLTTDGHTALLTRTSAPTIDRDDSRLLNGTPRAIVMLPDLTGPIMRCRPVSLIRYQPTPMARAVDTRTIWLAADAGKVWTLARDNDGDWAREWSPVDCEPAPPVAFDARYLLEAFRLLSPAGERVMWSGVTDGASLLISDDRQWAYLVMPIAGDVRAAMALIPGAADARQVAA